MARMFTVLFSIMCGGAAVGAKLHELVGMQSLTWIMCALVLQVIAVNMDGKYR